MLAFEGQTANDLWVKIKDYFIEGQNISSEISRAGDVYEVLHAWLTIHNPRQRWIYSRVPPVNPAFALAEVVWILNGSNKSDVINFWNPILPKYAGNTPEYYGAYGHRIRKNLGFDQLKHAYESLKDVPHSRQVVLQIWDGALDLPKEQGTPNSPDIPCNICSLLKLRNNKLEWTQIMRSNDLFLGVPFNIIQFTTLQEVIAGWLGVEVGTYNQLSDSLHIYKNQFSKLEKAQTEKDNISFFSTDQFKCSFDDSHLFFSTIYNNMKKIVNTQNIDMIDSLSDIDAPEEYCNIMNVLCADAAMRLKNHNLSLKIIQKCSNKLYCEMWTRWSKHWRENIFKA